MSQRRGRVSAVFVKACHLYAYGFQYINVNEFGLTYVYVRGIYACVVILNNVPNRSSH